MSAPLETTVPPGETPAATCRHCGRPFGSETLWALHLGEVHADALGPEERERYEAARKEESDELFLYHLKVVAALTLLYAGFVIAYMVVLAAGG